LGDTTKSSQLSLFKSINVEVKVFCLRSVHNNLDISVNLLSQSFLNKRLLVVLLELLNEALLNTFAEINVET
jgi:hypothetical protein